MLPRIALLVTALSFVIQMTGFSQNPTDTLNRLDDNGKKHGYWKKIERDTLYYEGRFDHGQPSGKFIYYFPDGDIKAITHFSRQGTYASSTLYYTKDRVAATGFYLNEKKDSLWKYYDYNGLLLKEERYKEGVPHGVWRVLYDTGKPSDVTNYKDGKKDGPWTQYFENGSVQSKAMYVDGKLDGVMFIYYPNGRMKANGRYVNNMKEGIWAVYDTEGKMTAKEEYRVGILLKVIDLQK